MDGIGVKQDYSMAVKWYKEAAKKGHADAMNSLGLYCDNGQGVRKSAGEAYKWYVRTAEAGSVDAMHNLGLCLRDGGSSEAFELLNKAAKRCSSGAIIDLGGSLKKGELVCQDLNGAFAWELKAAQAGNPSAMFNIGVNYEVGRVVDKNLEKALKWYVKAAEAGSAEAIFRLSMYLCEDEKKRRLSYYRWQQKEV